ncbi:MAG: SLBB domain-containing protein [Deltaproteobacteria bacterium]|nr:SLBB domain-containing protein [Deltaproteobacteria bacterium]
MSDHQYSPAAFEPTLSKRFFIANGYELACYQRDGGYQALRSVLQLDPNEIITTVKQANLRGRGGAGFPTGVKWDFVPKQTDKAKYLIVNADESEPGTFKDRYILSRDPHALLEGAAIAAYAIGANDIYIYIRGEFTKPYTRILAAIKEAYNAKIFGDAVMGTRFKLNCHVHRGAGAYICGEETSLLESLEGKIGRPRLKPPFPAIVGAFGGPTIINNVETLACVPLIFARGVDWFLTQGLPHNGGPKLASVSGHIKRPGVYEVPSGYPINELIELAGGVWKGRQLKAVIPGGSSTPVLVPRPCQALADNAPQQKVTSFAPPQKSVEHWPLETQAPLDFDGIKKVGSLLGSAGMIVLDDTTCMVRVLLNLAEFYAHESCGQCTPCREGTGWIAKMLRRLEIGKGSHTDLATLSDTVTFMTSTTICPLADAIAIPARSYFDKFKDEFYEHIGKTCWFPDAEIAPSGNTTWED